MENLIKALQIFLKYKNREYPTNCEHDILIIAGIEEDEISDEDKKELERLDFFWDEEYDAWSSFHYGSS